MPSHRYKDVDLVNSASFVVEGGDSSKDHKAKVFCCDSVTKLVSALFGDFVYNV